MDRIFFTLSGVLGILGLFLWTQYASRRMTVLLYLAHVPSVVLAGVATLVWPYSHWPIWGGWAFILGLALIAVHITVVPDSSFLDRWTMRLGQSALVLGWVAFILMPWFK